MKKAILTVLFAIGFCVNAEASKEYEYYADLETSEFTPQELNNDPGQIPPGLESRNQGESEEDAHVYQAGGYTQLCRPGFNGCRPYPQVIPRYYPRPPIYVYPSPPPIYQYNPRPQVHRFVCYWRNDYYRSEWWGGGWFRNDAYNYARNICVNNARRFGGSCYWHRCIPNF